jgi:peptidoglycan/LPS O-acetylase OafA/YrhL
MHRDPQRLFALDVLRGFAIALVLFRHVPIAPDSSEPVLGFLFGIGWAGVDLFFVLSGFLISGLLYREVDASGTIDFRRFWLRRGMKIWPSLAVYGSFTLLLIAAVWFKGGRWSTRCGPTSPLSRTTPRRNPVAALWSRPSRSISTSSAGPDDRADGTRARG